MPTELSTEFVTKKRSASGNRKPWVNVYQALFPTEPDYDVLKTILSEVTNAEQLVHYEQVRLMGGIARPVRFKTIQPNPNPPVIDPTDIVPFISNLFGSRILGGFGELMSKDHILQVDREGEFGRLGWVEFRGAISEAEVRQTLDGMSEDNAFALDGIIDTFSTTMFGIAANYSFQWVRYSQPRTLVNIEIVDNKPVYHYTFGPPVTIPLTQFVMRGVRLDRSDNKYFDKA